MGGGGNFFFKNHLSLDVITLKDNENTEENPFTLADKLYGKLLGTEKDGLLFNNSTYQDDDHEYHTELTLLPHQILIFPVMLRNVIKETQLPIQFFSHDTLV